MKSIFKMVSALLATLLLLAAFPVMNVDAAHYYTCNRAAFIKDVTVLDGSRVTPGETFTKTWQVRNIGTCTWTKDVYELVFSGGENFGITTSVKLKEDVLPHGVVNISIENMVAPSSSGIHYSYWKLSNGNNETFGVGRWGKVALFAKIKVVVPPTVTYEFATEANAASATWTSGSGTPPTFPSLPGSPNGSAIVDSTFKFESNVTATPGLLITPDNSYHGFIKAEYPPYPVNRGDRFQATVGCEVSATSCYVIFKLKYRIGAGREYTLGTYPERHEGLTRKVDINLNSLAGKNVSFILYVSAYHNPSGDSAIWGNPVIVGTGTPDGVSLTGADNGKQVIVNSSDKIILTLESNPTTGYGWQVIEIDNAILVLEGDPEYKQSPGTEGLTGAGGTETFRLKAVSTGETTLGLGYMHPWESVPPIETFSIQVVVQ